MLGKKAQWFFSGILLLILGPIWLAFLAAPFFVAPPEVVIMIYVIGGGIGLLIGLPIGNRIKRRKEQQERERTENMNALQLSADSYTKAGWTITSMTDAQFTATRTKPLGGLFWVGVFVGLILFIVPGILIAIGGIMMRGTETIMVTKEVAEARFGRP